jgi:hypothetical protein
MINLMITIKEVLGIVFYLVILFIGIVSITKFFTPKIKLYIPLRIILIILWVILNYYLFWEKIIGL